MLPADWEEHMDKVNQLFSKIPHYNKKDGKQTILQLGRVGKAKYVMDYRLSTYEDNNSIDTVVELNNEPGYYHEDNISLKYILCQYVLLLQVGINQLTLNSLHV